MVLPGVYVQDDKHLHKRGPTAKDYRSCIMCICYSRHAAPALDLLPILGIYLCFLAAQDFCAVCCHDMDVTAGMLCVQKQLFQCLPVASAAGSATGPA
jgi:hypothetical protein